ncbi:MAG: hypothetical protein NVSMB24_35690 [Mucilaginibacter sp.]
MANNYLELLFAGQSYLFISDFESSISDLGIDLKIWQFDDLKIIAPVIRQSRTQFNKSETAKPS